MEVWSGDIRLDEGGQSILRDVRLCLRDSGKLVPLVTSELSLSFSSFIDLQDIPLPCLAGPTLDLFTTSQVTEEWFAKYLLDDAYEQYESQNHDADNAESQTPWWAQGHEQSNLAILLRVDGHASATPFRLEVKEILLYASIPDASRKARGSIPTPPGSSSPRSQSEIHGTSENGELRTAQICAKLLYSGFPWSRDAEVQMSPETATSTDGAQFITPSTFTPEVASQFQYDAGKRRKVDALFEEAARETKRSRKRGGENVAHVMAKSDRPSPLLFPQGLREILRVDTREESIVEPQASNDVSTSRKAPSLLRSKSIGSVKDVEESRPSSRHSNPAISDVQKRSSLHRVSSMNDQEGASSPTAEGMSSAEAQNRNALTRVVMAGLRLYGFQAAKKPAVSTTQQPSSAAAADEEYKLLYHQTFKAAAFVFRKQIAVQAITQAVLREVVDKLLVLFCMDPMRQQLVETFTTSEPKDDGDEVALLSLTAPCEGAHNVDSGLIFRKSGVRG